MVGSCDRSNLLSGFMEDGAERFLASDKVHGFCIVWS